MDMSGESQIAAPRARVWTALNDPAVLARCIDGVESLTREDGEAGADARLVGKMNAKVGPVRATFAGAVTLTEVDRPRRVVLVGEGKGGVAGFAKGQAEVVLDEGDDASVTVLRYTVTSSVGGKLAQLGSRLIEGTAKAYAATFFERFKAEVEEPAFAPASVEAGDADTGMSEAGLAADPVAAAATVSAAVTIDVAEPSRGGVPPLIWGGALALAVLALLAWQMW